MKKFNVNDFQEWELKALNATDGLALEPKNKSLFLVNGHIFNDHKFHELAIGEYSKAIGCDADFVEAYKSIIDTYELQKDLRGAMDYIKKAFRAGHGVLEDIDLSKYPQSLLDELEVCFNE